MFKHKFSVGLSCCVFMVLGSVCLAALDIAPMTAVFEKTGKGKTVPTGSDAEVVTKFIAAASDQILWAERPSDAVEARNQLLAFRGQDPTREYGKFFTAALHARLTSALKEAAGLSDPVKKTAAQRNYSILIAQMDVIDMADLALMLLADGDSITRYWTMKALSGERTSAPIIAQVGDSPLRKKVLDAFHKRIPMEDQPMIHALMAQFAVRIKGVEGRDLMLAIADSRIKAYASWKVTSENVDADVLSVLAEKITASVAPEDKTILTERFAQYYSYVIQRLARNPVLPPASRKAIISAILTVEDGPLSNLLGVKSSSLRSAIQKNNMEALLKEHDAILGSSATAGSLAAKIKFSYEGNAKGPKALTPPTSSPQKPPSSPSAPTPPAGSTTSPPKPK